MNSKNQICKKCGHLKQGHDSWRIDKYSDWKFGKCLTRGFNGKKSCPCKKFKPKNHSQGNGSTLRPVQEPKPEDNSKGNSKEPSGTFNLSKKMTERGFVSKRDIKEFIKRLKGKYETMKDGYKFIIEIDKLAGEKLK